MARGNQRENDRKKAQKLAGKEVIHPIPTFPFREKKFSDPCLLPMVYNKVVNNVFVIEIQEHHERKRVPACARRRGFDHAREAEERFVSYTSILHSRTKATNDLLELADERKASDAKK